MTTFFLIRHASCDSIGRYLSGRMAGVPINDTGRREAAALAERLRTTGLAAIYASPLERTRETAGAIAAQSGLAVTIAPEFIEVEFGEWTGRSFESLAGDRGWQRYNAFRGDSRPPGGESLLEVQARALAGVEALCARHPGQRIAIVSHGDVLKSILMHAAGIPLDFVQRIEIAPASVSVVTVNEWEPKLLCLNHTGEAPG
jgi:probable phosphomutase (TIGR03848 family)